MVGTSKNPPLRKENTSTNHPMFTAAIPKMQVWFKFEIPFKRGGFSDCLAVSFRGLEIDPAPKGNSCSNHPGILRF